MCDLAPAASEDLEAVWRASTEAYTRARAGRGGRDYAAGGGSVSLALYDDRLEIASTGPLPLGQTSADLMKPHPSRP